MTILELIGAVSIIIVTFYILYSAIMTFAKYADEKRTIKREKEYKSWCSVQEKESWDKFTKSK